MVFCPKCGLENNDSAKFCKNCGTSLNANKPIKDDYVATGNDPTARVSNSNLNNSNNGNSKSDNKNLIIICLTIVICAILIAGALVLFSNNDSDNGSDALSDSASLNGTGMSDNSVDDSADDKSTADSTAESSAKTAKSKMKIQSGNFYTGDSADDKTYCSVYVGSKYAGESVKISVLYSNSGSTLNQGNIVPKTVSSDGYVEVPTAYVLDAYPDEAYITLYDGNGDVLDTQTVYLNPESGTQTF